jgi:hypothetical protein
MKFYIAYEIFIKYFNRHIIQTNTLPKIIKLFFRNVLLFQNKWNRWGSLVCHADCGFLWTTGSQLNFPIKRLLERIFKSYFPSIPASTEMKRHNWGMVIRFSYKLFIYLYLVQNFTELLYCTVAICRKNSC